MIKPLKNSIVLIILSLLSLTVNGALSLSTANNIKETAPVLIFDNGETLINNIDELLSIEFEDKFGNKTRNTPIDTALIKIDKTATLSQFKAKILTGERYDLSTLIPAFDYYVDVDGDKVITMQDYFIANWYYNIANERGVRQSRFYQKRRECSL